MTITRMATLTGFIPLTVGTFEAWGVGGGGILLWGAGEPRTENIYPHYGNLNEQQSRNDYPCLHLPLHLYIYIYIYISVSPLNSP